MAILSMDRAALLLKKWLFVQTALDLVQLCTRIPSINNIKQWPSFLTHYIFPLFQQLYLIRALAPLNACLGLAGSESVCLKGNC